jgi:two-component system alkaline phosphatase synthesis response regulator PhoP
MQLLERTNMSRMNDTARQPAAPRPPATPPSRKKVLIVDDEKDIVDLVAYNLARNGYDTITAGDGNDALDSAIKNSPDLIILDLMVPGIDGTEVARRLKADSRTNKIPIVMLTAKSEETDVVVGLTLGADDYVTKPFSMKVLLARVGSVLRRTEAAQVVPGEGGTLRAGPLSIDTLKHEVLVNDEAIKLTLTEFKLLSALLSARGRVLTRDQLMDRAMGTDVFVTDRAIDVHITAIRKKLGEAAWLVNTVRGVGYRLRESPEDND